MDTFFLRWLQLELLEKWIASTAVKWQLVRQEKLFEQLEPGIVGLSFLVLHRFCQEQMKHYRCSGETFFEWGASSIAVLLQQGWWDV